jgi:hypothetical protein
MRAKYFSETSVGFELTPRRYVLEGVTLQDDRYENLKS